MIQVRMGGFGMVQWLEEALDKSHGLRSMALIV